MSPTATAPKGPEKVKSTSARSIFRGQDHLAILTVGATGRVHFCKQYEVAGGFDVDRVEEGAPDGVGEGHMDRTLGPRMARMCCPPRPEPPERKGVNRRTRSRWLLRPKHRRRWAGPSLAPRTIHWTRRPTVRWYPHCNRRHPTRLQVYCPSSRSAGPSTCSLDRVPIQGESALPHHIPVALLHRLGFTSTLPVPPSQRAE